MGKDSAFTKISSPNEAPDHGSETGHDSHVLNNLTRQAAVKGNAEAQCLHGDNCSADGDEWEAVKWYRKAAEQGHPDALFRLGQRYEDLNLMENLVEALKCYHKAAENGQIDAQFTLGQMYAHGYKVNEDVAQAVKWFRMAANRGNSNAQYKLGKMYEEGLGVKRNVVQALKWFSLSASSRDLPAIADRDGIAEHMTLAQIAEAQQLVQKWKRK